MTSVENSVCFLKIYLCALCVCIHVRVYACMFVHNVNASVHGDQKKLFNFLEVELQVAVSHPMLVVETKPRSSGFARAASSFNLWAISSAFQGEYFQCFIHLHCSMYQDSVCVYVCLAYAHMYTWPAYGSQRTTWGGSSLFPWCASQGANSDRQAEVSHLPHRYPCNVFVFSQSSLEWWQFHKQGGKAVPAQSHDCFAAQPLPRALPGVSSGPVFRPVLILSSLTP